MAITVRRIDASDGPLLRQLRLAALADSPSAFGSTLGRESAFTDADWDERAQTGAAGEDRVTFIAEADTEPVGIAVGYIDDPGAGVIELVSMWVDPLWRRHGTGEKLVNAVQAWAMRHDADQLMLWVTEGNTAAIELYDRCGFAITGQIQPRSAGRPGNELRMAHPLRH